jgi:nicotinamidase-related amidase
MALATLDPNVALVVIDLQKGIVGLPTVHPAQEIVTRTGRIARAFRERRLPVVLVNVTGTERYRERQHQAARRLDRTRSGTGAAGG